MSYNSIFDILKGLHLIILEKTGQNCRPYPGFDDLEV